MKTNQSIRSITFILMATLLYCACSKDTAAGTEEDPVAQPSPETGSGLTFQAVIDKGGDFEPTNTSKSEVATTDSNEIIDNEVWNCTTTTYNATSPGGGDKGFPLFNPNASVIYPGSLLQGESLKNATPDVIAVERAGGTISYDLNNGNTASSFTVDKVAKSSIQNGMNQIIANAPSDLPANFVFTYSQVSSEQSLAFSMGVDYDTAFKSVSADFGFSQDKSYNRILVELNQSFYTMSFDIPTSVAGLFDESVTPEDLEKYVQAGNPATYISDVTYGRIYYMLIESTSSYTEMEAAVSAEFNGVAASSDVDIDASYISDLSELKVKVMAFGGESATTLLSVGNSNLSELVALLAKSATISTGLPISYVVRSVKSNQIVGVQLATEYDVTNCTPAGASGAPTYTAFWKGQVLQRMGPVGAAFSLKGTDMVLISKDGMQYMISSDVSLQGPFPIASLGQGEYPFGDVGIGAATNLDGNFEENSTKMVISADGQHFSYLLSNGNWLSKEPIINLISDVSRQGDNPFLNRGGVGAMFFFDITNTNSTRRYMFDINGNGYALYSSYDDGSFHDYWTTNRWYVDDTLPFDKVGGGVGFHIGQQKVFVMFDSSGTRYVITNSDLEIFGPFDL